MREHFSPKHKLQHHVQVGIILQTKESTFENMAIVYGGKDTINWYLNKQARDVCMVRTTSDKQYLKDFSFSRTSYSFLWPPLITLLARTRHRVIYDSTSLATIDHITSYYFPQQRYDLQMRLMYRNGIWNKETEITYCSCTKMFLHSSWVLQVLKPTMSQIFLGKII